jgi:hypothetical protein
MSKVMYLLLVPKVHDLRNIFSIIIFTGLQDRTNWDEEMTKYPKINCVVNDVINA